MKIINLILTSQNGGAEQAFVDYSAMLKKLGHDVLAVVKDDAPYVDQIEALEIPFKKIHNKYGDHDLIAVRKLNKIIEEFKAEAVVAHIGRSMVLARKAIKKISNRKVFLIAVNHSNNIKRSLGADIILSVNSEIFYRTVEAGQAEDRSFVISNAVDLTGAIEMAPRVNLQKKNVITLGAMARIDDKKGFEYLIRALALLNRLTGKKIKHQFLLRIAGAGPFEPKLRELVKALKLTDKVEFCGWVKDKKSFFQSIDIFCSPSSNETFGLVLLEAMKYRVPIIATDTDGSKEILRDRKDGVIVVLDPPESLDQRIAAVILEIVEKPDLFDALVENSFIRLNQKFSYAAFEDKMAEIFGYSS